MVVPQIVEETGVSADYWNEYYSKVMVYDLNRNTDEVAAAFEEFPVRKYAERFIAYGSDLMTEKNEDRITRLDELADIVNINLSNPSTFSESEFKDTINEVYALIYDKVFYE